MRSLPLVLASLAAATVLTVTTPSYAAHVAGQRDEITGTPAADDLKGTNGDDVIRGLGGNDAIDGRKGHDVLIGGAGDDSITDWLGIAGQQDDGAVDTFRGGAGNDILYVGHGDTVLAGAATTASTATTSARATSCTAAWARTCWSSTRTSTGSRPTSARRSWSSTRGRKGGMSFPFYDDPTALPARHLPRRQRRGLRLDPADGRAREIEYARGGSCEYLLTGPQSAGKLGIYRWTFGEHESGPDAHFHKSIAELFYVLEGEVRLYDGHGWQEAGAGDFLYVPEGGLHGFRGGNHASMLLMFTPVRRARTTSRPSPPWAGAAR